MSQIIPPRFLFRWSFAIPYCPEWPGPVKACPPLPAYCRVPQFTEFDGEAPFADLYLAWNDAGLGVGVEVRGKKLPAVADSRNPFESDGLELWIDTRATQNVHRATRYCHQFMISPVGSGPKRNRPWMEALPLAQARETTGSGADVDAALLTADVQPMGYSMWLWLPSTALCGFDPTNHKRLGFYAQVVDHEHGRQPLTVDEDFPFHFDPSLWQTLELAT